MKKILSWSAAGILSMGAFAACGSDDDKSPSTTAAPEVTTGDDTATTAGSSGDSNAAVEKFCADVADIVAKGPSDSGYAAALTQLQADAVSLAATATPADSARIQECVADLVPGG